MRFDAAQDGSAVADASDLLALKTFTIETWFTRDGPGVGPREDVGIATGDGGLKSAIPLVARGSYDPMTPAGTRPKPADRINWFLGIDAETSVLVADFQDTDGLNHPIMGTTVLADDAWYHATATYDGAVWRLYLDGRLEVEQPLVGVAPDPAPIAPDTSGVAPLSLATSLAAGGSTARGAFDGSMDEVRVWSEARTADDIRNDMRLPIDAAARGLVAAWALDQDSGTIGPDSIQPGTQLTLGSGATWVDSPVPDATIPSMPASLTAVAGPDGIALTWTAVEAADLAGYAVYRGTDGAVDPSAGPISGWQPVASNGFVDATAVVGVTYAYAVTAVDAYGNESDLSPVASATLETSPVTPPLIEVRLDLSSTVPETGGRRIDPGASTSVRVSVTPADDLSAGTLILGIPDGWTVVDAAGAASTAGDPRLTWDLTDIPAGARVTREVSLVAPLVSPVDGRADVESTFTVAFDQAGGATDGPPLTILVAPPVTVEHVVLGQVDDLTQAPAYLAADAAITDQQRFQVFRVRFRIRNLDEIPITMTPQLESRGSADKDFAALPPFESQAGMPFYVAREWVDVAGATDGTILGPAGESIALDGLAMRRVGEVLQPSAGHHSMGENPAPPLTIPGRSWTEVEFSVRATVDAPYLSGYVFRLSDAGTAIAGAVAANVAMGPEPALHLSSGQQAGVPVAGGASGTAADEISYRLVPPDVATPKGTPAYALLAVARTVSGSGPVAAYALGTDPAHGPFSGSTDGCALCHASHSAQGGNLLATAGAQSNLCFRCHDSAGTGASTRVQAQYTDPNVPANDPTTGAYFRHDALATGSGHTQAQVDEFGSRVNRHNECGDCHDAHAANAAASTQTATAGWTAPGQLTSISGVSVANDPVAGSTPAYTFLDGSASPITLEYQLCFKCHSGFTTLNARDTLHPSRWAQDKGVELNPANDSFHPIEAKGKNATLAMANSLAGSSPYKLWNFTTGSTVRCVNCHGDPRKVGSGPSAGSDLAPHAVPTVVAADGTQLNRGLLLQPYRDRILTGPTDAYSATDSALCLVCHMEAPFKDTTGGTRTDTNFGLHGKHVAALMDKGAGLGDIDTPGAGRGNAICSECHYRIHSTSSVNDFRTSPLQTGTDGGLVIFAPNVTESLATGQPSTNKIEWTRTGEASGTCALTCHGYDHSGKSYGP